MFPSGGESQSSCASVTITDDDLFEGEEMYCLTLESSDPDIIVGSTSFTCVLIADDDCMLDILSCIFDGFLYFSALTIGLNQSSYSVSEGVFVGVCVDIVNGTSDIPVTVIVDTSEGTADGKKVFQ